MRNKIRGLINRSLTGLGPEDMLVSAMDIMREQTISCIPVLEFGKPVGILTERGMVSILASEDGRFRNRPLHEVMNAPVITITVDMLIYEALHIFVSKNIRHLVVIKSEGKAVGIITLSDIVNHVGNDIMVEFQDICRYMSRVVFTLCKKDTLCRALAEMAKNTISCIIISENKKPIGILTERDIVRLASAGKDLSQLRVSEVMSSPVIQVESSNRVYQVIDIMRTMGIRRVVVVDDDGSISGLATQTNIMRGLESNYIQLLKQVIREQDNRIEQTSRDLSDLSQYLVTILNNSLDMAIVATDKDFRIIYYNNCAEQILNIPRHEIMGKRVQNIHSGYNIDIKNFSEILEDVQNSGSHTFTFDRVRGEEKSYFQARISLINTPDGYDLLGYVFMVQDISKQKQAEENMRYMAYHDILTGLPNRVAFNERLELELARVERNCKRLAVIIADLNYFKEVNDTYGHFTGDLLLKEVAERLAGGIRKSDTVARVGGDEFMIILAEITHDNDAVGVAQKLIDFLKPAINLKGVDYQASISMGIAFFPEHGTTSRRLSERAAQAMYVAKTDSHKNNTSSLSIYCDNFSEENGIGR